MDDIPIVLQYRNFNDDDSFRYVSSQQEKMMGIHENYVLINGVIVPTLEAKKKLTRFRILNGSNARYYLLGFSDNRKFQLIGSDGKDIVLKSYKGALSQNNGHDGYDDGKYGL